MKCEFEKGPRGPGLWAPNDRPFSGPTSLCGPVVGPRQVRPITALTTRGVQVGFFKSSQGLRNFVKSSHDQVKSGQNLVKSSSQVIKSSRLEHPYRCSSQLFSNQVKSQVKSRGRICFKSSHDQVKSGQNFGQVIKSSHQVKRLEHP